MYIGQLHALSYQLPPHQAAIFCVSKYKAEDCKPGRRALPSVKSAHQRQAQVL